MQTNRNKQCKKLLAEEGKRENGGIDYEKVQGSGTRSMSGALL